MRPLVELALDDLLDHVVGLALLARLLLEHAALGLALVLGDLVGRDIAAALARCDVDRDLAGELLEVVVAGDEVGLALDLDQHADLAAGVDVGGDDALARCLARALRGRGLALDSQELDRLVGVAIGLLQRGLAVHHRRARALAQHLDVLRRDGHQSVVSAGTPAGGPEPRVAGAAAAVAAARLLRLLGGGCGGASCAAACRRGGGLLGLLAGAVPPPRAALALLLLAARAPLPRRGAWPRPRGSCRATRRPPRRSVEITSSHERIESSLPGIGKRPAIGSTFESTRPMIGIPRRVASATAIASVFRSMIRRRLREALHVADAAEVVLELLELGLHRHALLGGQQVELAVVLELR